MKSIQELETIASQVRRDILRMVHAPQSGHPGGSLGCADLLVALYFRYMQHNPNFQMSGLGEDVFYLSNGHISPVFYSVLARSGYFPVNELGTFRKIDSRVQGHPTTHEGLPGVRIASGSLGQGLSVAIGNALGKKAQNCDKTVYCLMGDGELQEGQIWEAVMFAAHNKVDNLIAFVDKNGQQIDGPVEKINNLSNLAGRWASFGWEVIEAENGNDMAAVCATIEQAQSLSRNGKPIVVLLKTEMGYGVDFMMHSHKWHGIAPNDEQLAAALAQLPETLGDY